MPRSYYHPAMDGKLLNQVSLQVEGRPDYVRLARNFVANPFNSIRQV